MGGDDPDHPPASGSASTEDVDPRLDFISDYISKSLRVKLEKWQKMMSASDTRQVVMDFIDKEDRELLVITQTSAGEEAAGGPLDYVCRRLLTLWRSGQIPILLNFPKFHRIVYTCTVNWYVRYDTTVLKPILLHKYVASGFLPHELWVCFVPFSDIVWIVYWIGYCNARPRASPDPPFTKHSRPIKSMWPHAMIYPGPQAV